MSVNKFKIHWPSALLSLLLALTVCFAISGRERVETWIQVRLEIKDVPKGYVLLNANNLPSTVEVRLRGPSGLIRNLAVQNMPLLVSLSHIKPGSNLIKLSEDDIPLSGAFDIMEISPNALEIDVDQIVEKEVELTGRHTRPLPAGINKIELELPQNTILLTGPRGLLEKLDKAEALVSLPASILKQEMVLPAHIILPQGLKSMPAQLDIRVIAEGDPKEMVIQRRVNLEAENTASDRLQIDPEAVTITLQVPFYWDEKNPALNQVQAAVKLTDKDLAQKSIVKAVEITLPEGIKVLSVKPAKVTAAWLAEEEEAIPSRSN